MPNPNLPINYKKNTYIGARYVPKFSDTPGSEWDNSIQYEPLTIVLYQGNSYTSKTFVPVGVDINNTNYWANTGNYNVQIEGYREEVQRLIENVGALTDSIFYDFDRKIFEYTSTTNSQVSQVALIYIPKDNDIKVGVLPQDELNDVIYASYKFGASAIVNASVFDYGKSNLPWGSVIADGVVVPTFAIPSDEIADLELLVIMPDGKLDVMPSNTTISQLQSLGIKNSIQGFYHLMKNGIPTTEHLGTEIHGRSAIGQKPDGSYILLSCTQNMLSDGLLYQDVISILQGEGCNFIYALDGGGTAQIAYHNLPLLPPSREKVYRKNPGYLYVKAKFPEYVPNDNMYALGSAIGNLFTDMLNIDSFYTQSLAIKNSTSNYAGLEFYNAYNLAKPGTRTAKINTSVSSNGRGNLFIDVNNGNGGNESVLFANMSGITDINDTFGYFYRKPFVKSITSFRQLDSGIYQIDNSADPKPIPTVPDEKFTILWNITDTSGNGYGLIWALSGAYIATVQGSTYTVNKISTSTS